MLEITEQSVNKSGGDGDLSEWSDICDVNKHEMILIQNAFDDESTYKEYMMLLMMKRDLRKVPMMMPNHAETDM